MMIPIRMSTKICFHGFDPLITTCLFSFFRKEKCIRVTKNDLIQVLKNNQFTYANIEKLQEHFKSLSFQCVTKKVKLIESNKANHVTNDLQTTPPVDKPEAQTLAAAIQTDENCMRTVQDLADLHEETMSIINLQLAVDALESGDYQLGIETLQTCAKNGTDAAALYNLGICYERGIGVEEDRAKVTDLICQKKREFSFEISSRHVIIIDKHRP